jgi:NitT/TauT family transport system ATP-binding protein
MSARIVLDRVGRIFQLADGGEVVSVADLSFAVADQEVVAIVGKTGCGKSTCLSLMLGLIPPTRGTVRIDGLDPFADFERFRGRIGVIFQTDRLIPWRGAIANAEIGLELLEVPKAERRERAAYWLGRLGLGGFENAYPHELSGGMRQRVAIARAFFVDPNILFCDEAFGHLDAVTGSQLRASFLELVSETKKTCVFVTHDIDEALDVGQRVLVFDKPAKVLWDLRTRAAAPAERAALKAEIIRVIDAGRAPDSDPGEGARRLGVERAHHESSATG